jgi:general stress protein 26
MRFCLFIIFIYLGRKIHSGKGPSMACYFHIYLKNKPMSTKEYLLQDQAIDKLKKLATEIDICLFCSGTGIEDDPGCRPMTTAGVDDAGNLWFLSDKDSQKNQDIALNPRVKLYYSHPGKSSFLVVSGDAEILFNKALIDRFWNPLDKIWFREGKDDPAISLIKVKPYNAHFWDTRGNRMVNFLKLVVSAASGKTLVEGEEGSLLVN